MNAEELKSYLSQDIQRIEKLVESIGCHSLWNAGENEIRCAPPDSNNKTAISIRTDNMGATYYSNEIVRGDIISLVQHFRNEDFASSMRYIKALLGISSNGYVKKARNPLQHLLDIRKKSKKILTLDDIEVERFTNDKLKDFVIMPHINLFYEGITPQTCEKFNIGYDPSLDRIIFPHYNYDDKDSLVGITGRTLASAEEIKEFDIPKYWNYIRGYAKMYNLYGFSHSIESINDNKMVVISEAEKSVLKHSSMTRGNGFTVSTGGHELSDVQAQILLEMTSKDTEIVIAYDKDIQDMKDRDGSSIGRDFLIDNVCSKVSRFRKTSYIWDTHGILGEKDAPQDKGVKIFNHLLKYRKNV